MNPLRHKLFAKSRPGVTLSEVLVSLLVMSIGVVALATLFPISTLRMIQATQLTQATQLRYNAEALMGAQSALLDGMPSWKPSWSYSQGDLCIPTVKSTQYFVCTGVDNSSPPPRSGVREPLWSPRPGQTTTDGAMTWTARQAKVYVIDPLGWEERCSDMLGLSQSPAPLGADLRNTFGRGTLSTAWPPPWAGSQPVESPYRIVRFRGTAPHSLSWPLTEATPNVQARRLRLARDAAMLPDSFRLQADSTDLAPGAFVTDGNGRLTGIAVTDLTFDLWDVIKPLTLPPAAPGGTPLVGPGEQLVEGRITLFDVTGRFSEVRSIWWVDSTLQQQQIIHFGDPISSTSAPLDWNRAPFLTPPAVAPAIGRVVIETREQRFSWILACRNVGGSTYASVVCFFNRSGNGEDELIHPAHFSPSLPGIDNGFRSSDDVLNNNRVVVQFNPAATEKPFLKRGGWVCDAQNNRWYRVTSYQEVTSALAAQQALYTDAAFVSDGQLAALPGAVLTLEKPIEEGSGYYPNPNAAYFDASNNLQGGGANPNPGPGGVILMPGVIDVYPLDPSLPWEEN